jgi:HAD superfamily hydrolase (TIGR01509 family)
MSFLGKFRSLPSAAVGNCTHREKGQKSLPPLVVMFDLDGVLVDTQDAENGGLSHLAAIMGLALSESQASDLFSGKRIKECVDDLVIRTGRQAPRNYEQIVRDECDSLLGSRPSTIDGVPEALAKVKMPKCVVSNSPFSIMEKRLDTAGLRQHFDLGLFSAYELNSWKPDPRIYRLAATACDVEPRRCVVIEDSETGVQAAMKAEMHVMHYRGSVPSQEQSPGCMAFAEMAKLPQLITTT